MRRRAQDEPLTDPLTNQEQLDGMGAMLVPNVMARKTVDEWRTANPGRKG